MTIFVMRRKWLVCSHIICALVSLALAPQAGAQLTSSVIAPGNYVVISNQSASEWLTCETGDFIKAVEIDGKIGCVPSPDKDIAIGFKRGWCMRRYGGAVPCDLGLGEMAYIGLHGHVDMPMPPKPQAQP